MPRPNRQHIPVSDGSSHFFRTETSCFIAIDAWFPAHTTLPRHTHDRAIFATMLDGGFECTIARGRFDLRTTSIWVEPTGEPHDNRVGPGGARVLVLQPNSAHHDIFEPFRELLDVPTTAHHGGVAIDERRPTRAQHGAERAPTQCLSPGGIGPWSMNIAKCGVPSCSSAMSLANAH